MPLHTYFYIIYGVIQGFPALRKAITTHVLKNYNIFFTCLTRQSAAERHLLLAPLSQADKQTWNE